MNFLIFAPVLFFASAVFAGIKIPNQKQIDVSSDVNINSSYTFHVSSTITPIGVFSSVGLKVPVRLSMTCEGKLVTDSTFFYNRSMKDIPIKMELTVENFDLKCPTLNPFLTIEPNGVELNVEAPFFQYTLNVAGSSVAGIRDNRLAKATELVKLVSSLGQIAGSRETAHCLIVDNSEDVSLTGILLTLTNQYERFYGHFEASQIQCPAAAEGVLGKEEKVCKANPGDLSPFCLVYDRYLTSRAWYDTSISRLNEILARLGTQDQELLKKIHELNTQLQVDKNSKDRILDIK